MWTSIYTLPHCYIKNTSETNNKINMRQYSAYLGIKKHNHPVTMSETKGLWEATHVVIYGPFQSGDCARDH